jgi:hypothetical protein
MESRMNPSDFLDQDERRHHPRIVLNSPARLETEGRGSVSAVAVDISTAGVGLLCDEEGVRMLRERLALDSPRCEISIMLPEGYEKDEIRATTRVAWIADEHPAGYSVGLEFLSLSGPDSAYLQQMADEAYEDAREAIRQLTS